MFLQNAVPIDQYIQFYTLRMREYFYQLLVLDVLYDAHNTFCSRYPISVVTWLVTLRSAANATHLRLSKM